MNYHFAILFCLCHCSVAGGSASGGRGIMAGGIPGSVSVSLHPLVLLNVSDHWTRQKAQQKKTAAQNKDDPPPSDQG